MEPLNADRTALLLVDLQEWIVRLPLAPLSGPEVVTTSGRLLAASRARGMPVVMIRYLRSDGADGGERRPENGFVAQIRPADAEFVVTKTGLDAFAGRSADGRDLDTLLRGLGVDTVVLAGIATGHGVGATAVSAVAHGYRCVVAGDATAASSSGEHEAALTALRAASVEVRSVYDILAGDSTGEVSEPSRPAR